MGIDIHAVIECRRFGSFWHFADVEIARDSTLFRAIGLYDDAMYPSRGIPPDHSTHIIGRFYIAADEAKEIFERHREGTFKPEEIAEGWGDWAVELYEKYTLLPGPDWFAPNWLRVNELEKALAHNGLTIEEQSPEFRAVIASMRELSQAYGDENVRLVFWFSH